MNSDGPLPKPTEPSTAVFSTSLLTFRIDKYVPYTALLVILAVSLTWVSRNGNKSQLRLPGPQGLPIFGNLFDFRSGNAKTLDLWAQKYQDLYRLLLGNKQLVILNTRSAVAQTIVKQGTNYQSRPEWHLWHGSFVNGADTGGVRTLGTSKWSSDVSKMRKWLGPVTSAQRLPRYNHFVSRRYLRLIQLLAEKASTSRDLGYICWSTTIGLVTDQLVGKRHDDEFTKLICDTEINVFRLRTLGAPLHDWVPTVALFEMLINASLSVVRPFARFLGLPVPKLLFNRDEETSEYLRLQQTKYCKEQLADLNRRFDAGDMTPSQLGDMFRSLPERPSAHDQYLIMTTLSGSGMAVGTTLNWLFGFLASRPDLQDKAHQAIHDVYGGQVPDPHDTDRVEYIRALGQEAGRYWTPIRLGFSRETYKDSNVNEYFIPKGTTVVYNSYQINRDPAGYDEPDKFKPERWLNGSQGRTDAVGVVDDKIGVPHMGHGAGRRLCLGVPNVNKSLYGVLALTLHMFTLERGNLDDKGLADVFPSFRSCRQTGFAMDPILDQVSIREAQGVPCATGIRLVPRDPQQLAHWISEGHKSLQSFDSP